jgi:hypothetical protein
MNESTEIAKSDIDPKTYLEYIDKEMTFCGIITTFSLACVLFMIDKVFSINKTALMFSVQFRSVYFIIALLTFIISAFLLFKQRANLAHHYGQISLEYTSPGITDHKIKYWLNDVDSWKFWFLYIYAIGLILCGFIETTIMVIISIYRDYYIAKLLDQFPYSYITSLFIVLIVMITVFFRNRKLLKKNMKLPHDNTYTRIGVSKIENAGVGIIAIRDIPKDEFIFFPDDDELVWIEKDKITDLPDKLKKLYIDFCIKKDNLYGCPINFNNLTPAWYLNNSTDPNVYSDNEFRFKAKREIKEGEELTVDYSTYSEDRTM